MSKVRVSPDKHTFQSQKYKERLAEDPVDSSASQMLDLFDEMLKRDLDLSRDPEWQKDNLEYDLRSTDWIIQKVKQSNVYAQHLYASMCNREFTKNELWPLLTEKKWSCSWRHAGGIVADMREEGDYIDWYCSGIRGDSDITDEEYYSLTKDQQEAYHEMKEFVSESVVTDEIREDLLKLGWVVLDD